MHSCIIEVPELECEMVTNWGENNLKEKSLMAVICQLNLEAAIYHIRQQRSAIIHQENINN